MQFGVEEVFSQDGPLAQTISGYQLRTEQVEMAVKVADALAHQDILVAEAGTGTGKTFAYLVPAILSGQKIFISTGTKNLQDQLYKKDLPKLREVLAVPFTTALLKGRSNYLCHHRLKLAESEAAGYRQKSILVDIQEWQTQSSSGDLSEANIIDEKSSLWPKVTSTVDNCLGQQCNDYESCLVVKARRQAQEADIVVINHHLLMSDLVLKESGNGEVLPDTDAYIIDEAHQLPNIANQFLGQRISSYQLEELSRDSISEMEVDAADMQTIKETAQQLDKQTTKLHTTLGSQDKKVTWPTLLKDNQELKQQLESSLDALIQLRNDLEIATERGKGLDQCYQRSELFIERLSLFIDADTTQGNILWLENRQSGFIFHATPQVISEQFQQWLTTKPKSWIFTSATLTVAGRFNNFNQQLGLDDPLTAIWQSPFDYQQQSLLYLPTIPLEPNHHHYNSHIARVAEQVIEAAKGRVFLLFTSYRALNEVAEKLASCNYPLFIQGSKGKNQLLDEFRDHGNAVLLGTNSFWEGVDVRGEALSCVLIDKIPFASPGDPVLEAKIEFLKSQGGNPFRTIQIPAAIIQLRQGVGRLIRDQNDKGVLVLCDPRYLTKPYGKLFLQSLPPMPITQSQQDVEQFLADLSI